MNGPHPDAFADRAAPAARPRLRRYAVPLGLGALAAVAATLAAMFLASAQGWQGPALAPQDGAPTVAADAPLPAPAAMSSAARPRLAAARERRAPPLRPAATPVIAQAAVLAVPALAVSESASASVSVAHAAEAAGPPVEQPGPADVRRLAREADSASAPSAPGVMGYRSSTPIVITPASAPR